MSREKLIYIASPYAGDIETNTAFAKKACWYAIHQGHTPIAREIEEAQRLGIPIRQIGELEIKQEALPAEMEQSEAPGQSMGMA